MTSWNDPLFLNADPERTYDVAIVGAGIIGLAQAYHLARRGLSVVVFERHARAEGASIRNFGMLWPIGQPAGEFRDLALRSLEHWREILQRTGIWHDPVGSLHLAYHDDEAQVLEEFVRDPRHTDDELELLDAETIGRRTRAVRRDGLKRALYSPSEVCVDPREVVAELPQWLATTFGVGFAFGTSVTDYDSPRIHAGGRDWRAGRLVVCSGHETRLLYPEVFESEPVVPCKLQMLRSAPCANGWRLGPMLAGGLTLRHYSSFADCPSVADLKRRVARENPEYDAFGIHVMASQNGRGELVLGDSHEYGETIEPFDKDEVDGLILNYLQTFLDVPEPLRIASRWHGIYIKHRERPFAVRTAEDGAVIVLGLGGAGMTLSFGLTERVAERFVNA